MTTWRENLQIRCEALGLEPTPEQEEALEQWVLDNVDKDFWYEAALISLHHTKDLYTNLRMRMAECGIPD